MPPYDLMSFYSSGAKAMAAPEMARADIQEAKLQQQYNPQVYAAKAKQFDAQAQEAQLKVLTTQAGIDDDNAAKETLSKIVGQPETAELPMSEVMERGAKELMAKGNPMAGIKLAEKASKVAGQEATSAENKAKTLERTMDAIYSTVAAFDPADANAVEGSRDRFTQMGVPKNIIDKYSEKWTQATTPEARQALQKQLATENTTIRREGEISKYRETLRKEAADIARENNRQREFVLALARITRSDERKGEAQDNKERNFGIARLEIIASNVQRDERVLTARKNLETELKNQANGSWFRTDAGDSKAVEEAREEYDNAMKPYRERAKNVYKSLPKDTQEQLKEYSTDLELVDVERDKIDKGYKEADRINMQIGANEAWGSYEPEKYDYRYNDEGKLQRKLKGK